MLEAMLNVIDDLDLQDQEKIYAKEFFNNIHGHWVSLTQPQSSSQTEEEDNL